MSLTPNFPRRKLHRLKGYDYSQEGLYFITICIDRLKNPRMMPFGKVVNGEMKLNDAGKMVERWYWELENIYPDNKKYGVNIFDAIGWFITMTINEYIRGVTTMGWQAYNQKLWQRGSWDIIIRYEKSYQNITNYIKNNPKLWRNDRFFD